MIEDLKQIIVDKCYTFNDWTKTFDEFVKQNPRDSSTNLYKYKDRPDYCVWDITDEEIKTISYRYIHCLKVNGDMHCLQEYHPDKIRGISNYQKLDPMPEFPILKDYSSVKIEGEQYIYTYFSSPGELGYPPPYMLFNIMMNSNNVVEDFKSYIKKVVDAYYNLGLQCKQKNLAYYRPNHVLVNHFVNEIFYFKDSVFFEVDTALDLDNAAEIWKSSIDGFRRAEGIINAYRSRTDYSLETERLLFDTIKNLSEYGKEKCLNLKNV